MSKLPISYTIEVVFTVEVEAMNNEDAENVGWDWRPKHPQNDSLYNFEYVTPDRVEVVE